MWGVQCMSTNLHIMWQTANLHLNTSPQIGGKSHQGSQIWQLRRRYATQDQGCFVIAWMALSSAVLLSVNSSNNKDNKK